MSEQFEWHEEEATEEAWVDGVSAETRFNWRWLIPVLIVVIIAGAGLAYREAQRRTEEAFAQAETTVRNNLALLANAAAIGDAEVFALQLSDDDEWEAGLKEVVSAELWLDRSGFSLHQASTWHTPTVTIANDLTTATVTATIPYTSPYTAALTLTHTFHFERNDAGLWQYAPRSAEAWGEATVMKPTDFVTVTFSEHDGELIQQIVGDMLGEIRLACQQPIIGDRCGNVHLSFGTDIDTIARLSDWTRHFTNIRTITLPTPSLVGIPQNEQGLLALRIAYTREVLSALFGRDITYECCAYADVARLYLERELLPHRLDSFDFEISAYGDLLQDTQRLEQLGMATSTTLDGAPPDLQIALIALFEYLEADEPSGWTEQMRETLSSDLSTYPTLTDLLNDQFDSFTSFFDEHFINNWVIHLQEQTGNTPFTPIEQFVTTTCVGDDYARLMHFNPFANRWARAGLIGDVNTNSVHSLADGAGNWFSDPDGKLTIWYRNQDAFTIAADPINFIPNTTNAPHTIVSMPANPDEPDKYVAIDPDLCRASGCSLRVLNGIPHWSTDRQHTLLDYNDEERNLVLGDGDGVAQQYVDDFIVGSPFWHNNETLGYVKVIDGEHAVIASRVDDLLPQVWFTLESILPAPPSEPLQIVPNDGRLLIYATTDAGNFLILYDGDVESLAPPDDGWQLGSFSSNNRYATMLKENAVAIYDSRLHGVYLYPQPGTAVSSEWSADGEWALFTLPNKQLTFIHPATGSEYNLPLHSNCTDAQWRR